MTKNQNTVAAKVDRNRAGYRAHKTTVRKKILPNRPAGAPNPDTGQMAVAAGPAALGLTGANSMSQARPAQGPKTGPSGNCKPSDTRWS